MNNHAFKKVASISAVPLTKLIVNVFPLVCVAYTSDIKDKIKGKSVSCLWNGF